MTQVQTTFFDEYGLVIESYVSNNHIPEAIRCALSLFSVEAYDWNQVSELQIKVQREDT